ncbi:hydrolase [Cytobacillus sp. Hm23]
MSKEKEAYYISLGSGEISRLSTASPWNYKVFATDEEITTLREYFDQNYSTEWQNFFRAHIPYIQYHDDEQNDAYDETLEKILQLIYQLGDRTTREFIEEQGLLHDVFFNEKT